MQRISDILDNQTEMLSDGLKKSSGEMTTQSNQSLTHQDQQGQQVSTREQNRLLALRDDNEGRVKLSSLLLICFDVLDTYGKEPEQLENINNAFQMFLDDYSYESIERAFKEYMKENTAMPKPADIIKIINEPVVVSSGNGLTDKQQARLEYLRNKHRQG